MKEGLKIFLRQLLRNKVGFAGFVILILIIFMSFVLPIFIPLDTKVKINEIYQPPSLKHPLGTDFQGRDILSQIIHGGKDVIIVAVFAGVIGTTIAVSLGALSGFAGGKTDMVITSLADILLTIPHFPLLAVLAAFIRLSSPIGLALLLGLLSWPGAMRAIRAQVLSLKERDFVEAARVLNLGTFHIIFKEIIPNMMNYIVMNFIFTMRSAVYSQVGLIILGFVPYSSHNWGIMIYYAWTRGAIFYKNSVLYLLAPISMIALFQWSLVSFARALEGIFNPRLREG
ncbi:MAG: ABC transporter permease [Thermotoga sp.]|nr:MAG: ABC transporter permease [Thermotoga sp.]HDM70896.1 ABC transporter permease [Thermotogales bacterium]